MPLLMIRNDITTMRVDAVVNPANPMLRMGRGTSQAIFQAAGERQLAEACARLGGCPAGEAVITEGFGLPARYIIHAVCPPWQGGGQGEAELLSGAYLSALRLARTRKLETIAFPLLSSGSYGYPKGDALRTAVSAISRFLLEEDMTVYLVLYDNQSVEVSRRLFRSIEEYIDDHYVEERDNYYKAMAPMPGTHDSLPYTSVPIPGADESLPQTSVLMPETDENLPQSSVLMPEADESLPRMSSPMPGASQSLPRVSSSMAQAEHSAAFRPRKRQNANVKPSPRKLEDLIRKMDETFSQMLLRLIDERGLKDSAVYRKANIDRRLFSKIRNDVNYNPTKKTVLSFAIALELSLDETKDLLMKAGFALSNSSKFDVIISYFIENRHYDIFEINEILFAYHQPILGE